MAAVGHRPVELGREDVRVAWAVGEHLAEELLRPAALVLVRGVDEIDPELKCFGDARLGPLAADAAAVGEPGAEADLRHLQVAGAELSIAHAFDAIR